MALGTVASDLGGIFTGDFTTAAKDWIDLQGHLSGTDTSSAATAVKSALSMSLGDYTLVAVGIVLAIGALLISAKPTVIKAVGTVKDAVTFAA